MNIHKFKNKGWEPIVVWGCEVKDIEKLSEKLDMFIQNFEKGQFENA